MSERMYLIVPLGYPLKEVDGAITESELKRRLSAILVDVKPEDVMDGWIDILLHGEGKEEPVPRPDEWPHVPFPKKPLKDQLVRLNGTDNPEPVQPDPWEEYEMETDFSFQGGQYTKSERVRLRKMPREK